MGVESTRAESRSGPPHLGAGVPREVPVTARLIVQSPGKVEVFPLSDRPISLGREPSNDLPLSGYDVSRRHCLVEANPSGGHRIRDLGSTNGVVLNDRRVAEAPLRPFDRIRLGEVTMVYLDPATDADRVGALLAPRDAVDTDVFGPNELSGPPPRDRLLFLLLTIQELREEEKPGPLFELVLTELLASLDAERVALILEQPRTRQLWLVAEQGRGGPLDAAQLAGVPIVRQVLEGSSVLVGESPLDPATIFVPVVSPLWETRERRRAGVPAVRGFVLLAGHGREGVTTEEMRLLHGIGRQLAIVFANARLQRQADTDVLTRLSTRASLEGIFQSELRSAESLGSSLGVVILDVDDFKRVNDTLGHAVGDRVLQAVGALLQSTLRSEDSAGRWGGEEFLVVLPETDLAGAHAAAQKIVRSVAALTLEGIPPLTISAGVAAFPTQGRGLEELLLRADKALYAAKSRGKNRCEAYRLELEEQGSTSHDLARTRVFQPGRVGTEAAPAAWLHSDLRSPCPLHVGTLTLGRGGNCNLVLPHPLVSRLHGRIRVDAAGVTYEDLRSRNGSRYDGEPVLRPVRLEPGRPLMLGPYSFELRPEGSWEDETAQFDAMSLVESLRTVSSP